MLWAYIKSLDIVHFLPPQSLGDPWTFLTRDGPRTSPRPRTTYGEYDFAWWLHGGKMYISMSLQSQTSGNSPGAPRLGQLGPPRSLTHCTWQQNHLGNYRCCCFLETNHKYVTFLCIQCNYKFIRNGLNSFINACIYPCSSGHLTLPSKRDKKAKCAIKIYVLVFTSPDVKQSLSRQIKGSRKAHFMSTNQFEMDSVHVHGNWQGRIWDQEALRIKGVRR